MGLSSEKGKQFHEYIAIMEEHYQDTSKWDSEMTSDYHRFKNNILLNYIINVF